MEILQYKQFHLHDLLRSLRYFLKMKKKVASETKMLVITNQESQTSQGFVLLCNYQPGEPNLSELCFAV